MVVRSVPRIFNLKRSLLGDNIKKENKRLTVVYLNIFILVKKMPWACWTNIKRNTGIWSLAHELINHFHKYDMGNVEWQEIEKTELVF